MCHQVKDDVDAERVGPLLRELAKEILVLALALPAVAIVHVVCRDDHDAALFIEDRADMHVFALLVTAILAGVAMVLIVLCLSNRKTTLLVHSFSWGRESFDSESWKRFSGGDEDKLTIEQRDTRGKMLFSF